MVSLRSKTVGVLIGLVLSIALASTTLANYTDPFPQNFDWFRSGYGPSGNPTGAWCIDAHISSVGWQGWKCNGAIAGDGVHQIEAIAFNSVWGDSMLQVHLASLGWSPFGSKTYGAMDWFGTTGQSRRLEALAIEPNPYVGGYMCGQAYVQGLGWQSVQHSHPPYGQDDIMLLGTAGQARALYYIWLNWNC